MFQMNVSPWLLDSVIIDKLTSQEGVGEVEGVGERVGEGVGERGVEDMGEEVGEGVDANFTPMIYKVVGAIVEPEIYVIYNQQWYLFWIEDDK